MITVKASPQDKSWIYKATELIAITYSRNTYFWKLESNEQLWKIHFGVSAAIVGVNQDSNISAVKFFYDETFKSKIRNFFGFSKAKKTYKLAQLVSDKGIKIARPLGYSKVCFSYGFVFSELLTDFERVDVFVKTNSDNIWSSLGAFIRDMHDKGVVHKDLSPRNVMVNSAGEFLLLDYEDCSLYKKVPKKLRLRDLFHMYERLYQIANKQERKLFVDGYATNSSESSDLLAQLLKMIDENPSKYTKFTK